MRRLLCFQSVALVALIALSACGHGRLGIDVSQLPARFKYEMASCPAGTTSANCIAAQACSGGSCSGTAPTTDTSEGMFLQGITAFRLTICAAAGQTLSGAGTMVAYALAPGEGLWTTNATLNQTVTSTGRCQTFPDFLVGVAAGRVRFVSSSVTVSGGATLDSLIDGQIGSAK